MTNTRRIVLFVALVACLVPVMSGCASPKPLKTEADFYGFITDIQAGQAKDVKGILSVESDADKIVTKYVITVNKDTAIFRQEDSNLKNADFNELENKQWVKIWFTGSVLESWPMQATAKQIVISP
jgi:Protein of unknown function (DUF3221)